VPTKGTIEALPPEQQDAYRGDQLGALILGAGGPSGDPNADPRGGFSYLDNIAQVLTGADRGNAEVLMQQLLGTRIGENSPFKTPYGAQYGQAPQDLSTDVVPPYVPHHASDIPSEQGSFDKKFNPRYTIETDPSAIPRSGGGTMEHELRKLLQGLVEKRRT